MLKKHWKLKPHNHTEGQAAELAASIGVSRVFASILMDRGIRTAEEYRDFVKKGAGCANPYSLPDMEKGARRIALAVERGEKILIYGDYDADGVTSVALMYLFLSSRGARVEYHIPDRFSEGYGMNVSVIDTLAEKEIGLIITVDTGISALGEIERAAGYGIDTVVTDHHECLYGVPQLAYAAINPKRPDCKADFCEYSGVGVAFMTVMAVLALEMPLEKARELTYSMYSDIAAIGTIADVMPIVGENRAIVKRGMDKISNLSCNPGIAALVSASKGKTSKITSSTLGFVLGPRINAAGRLAHANQAEELFLTSDYTRCTEIASSLCKLNARRQEIEGGIMDEACAILEREGKNKKKVIVLASGDWNHGVIGIVAAKLVEKYNRPVILFCLEGEFAKGSGRGVEGFNLAEAIDACSEHIVKYGGHAQAAGLTVRADKLWDFEEAINKIAEEESLDIEKKPDVTVDACLMANEITLPLANELILLEPYGMQNPEPLFLLKGAVIRETKILSGGKHTRLILNSDGLLFEAMLFGVNGEDEGMLPGDALDILFTVEQNEYLGRRKLNLNIRDFAFSSKEEERFSEYADLWQDFLTLPTEEKRAFLPSREECIPIYKTILNQLKGKEGYVKAKLLLPPVFDLGEYVKMRIALEAFSQSGIFEYSVPDIMRFKIKLLPVNGKVDITAAPIMRGSEGSL